ncbi:MAG: ABC transporter ATP-binding protein [Pirellulaceae bacterium]|nr:ABC transporter ATP-binding protein [Pirellulaceae bacterium]
MTRLVVEDLSKQFVTEAETLQVLAGVSFKLDAGENLAIVGASGSGKSTLLYILGTLDTPTSGTVLIDGINPFKLGARGLAEFRNQSIGFVFQDHHLLPQLSVLENVLLPAMAQGRPSADIAQRARHLIDEVGLSARIDHIPGRLSGGERQRVAVARALLHRPKLLLADEPTGNLDAATADHIADLLLELPRREGASLIVVTHSDTLSIRAARCLKLVNHQLAAVA